MFTPSSACARDRVPRAWSILKCMGTAAALLVFSCSLRDSSISLHLGVLTSCHECLQLLINSYISCLSRNSVHGVVCKSTANEVSNWEVQGENVLDRDADCCWDHPVRDEGTCDSCQKHTPETSESESLSLRLCFWPNWQRELVLYSGEGWWHMCRFLASLPMR